MAPHLCRQWGDDRPPVRGHPPLPPVADDQGREQQVLDRVGLVALASGACRYRHPERALLRDRGRAPAAAPLAPSPPRLGRPVRPARLLHPAGRQLGPLRQALQAGVLLTELPVLLLQRRRTREQLCDQLLQLIERSSVQVGKRCRHADQRTTPTCQGKALASAHTMDCPAFLTGYVSDGWAGYKRLKDVKHDTKVVGDAPAHLVLPWVHRVFANAKRWALGVYHGLRPKHLQAYLDEFVFRFDRRRTPAARLRPSARPEPHPRARHLPDVGRQELKG